MSTNNNNTQGSPSSPSAVSHKGKEKVSEEPETILINMKGKEETSDMADKEDNGKEEILDKGKEIAVETTDAEQNLDNKRKAIEIEDSEEDATESKSPKSDDGDLRGDWSVADLVGNDLAKKGFTCKFCANIFPTSQALGGHQNGHRWERKHRPSPFDDSLPVNPSNQITPPSPPTPTPAPPPPSPQILPPPQQHIFIGGNQGDTLNPMIVPHQLHYHHHHHPHAQPYPNPQAQPYPPPVIHHQFWPNVTYGRIENGQIRPQWFPGNDNTTPYFIPQNAAGFNSGYGHGEIIQHRHYYPGLIRFYPHGVGAVPYNGGGGGIHISDVDRDREIENNGENTNLDFFLLPGRVTPTMVREEIDFGLVEKRNGETSENPEE